MIYKDYIEDLSLAIDLEDFEEANIIINKSYRDKDVSEERYNSILSFAKNRGFKFGQHYNLLEVK